MKAIVNRSVLIVILVALPTTLFAQSLTSIGPNSVQQGQVLTVAISGQDTHFNFNQGSRTTVWFSQGSPTNIWVISDTLLVAELDFTGASPGVLDLNVYNEVDGTLTLYDGFTVTPYNPTLTSITPGGAYQSQKLSVRITGQNANFFQGSGAIAWLSQGNSLIVSRHANAIGGKIGEAGGGIAVIIADFDIPADANSGFWDVHTFSDSDSDDQLTLTDGFVITRPGDLTCDGMINFEDLAVLGINWLEGSP